jgi:hypothetical protein
MIRPIADITRRLMSVLNRSVSRPTGRGGARGIALLIALVTITILSAAVVEYTYSTRVNLRMSVNAKEKTKAYFLARSGVNLSWLLLNLQYSLQEEAQSMQQQSNNSSSVGGSCNPTMISTAMRRSNFQMYQYLDLLLRPFNNGRLETPIGGIDLAGSGVEGFGQFAGEFDVDVEPESGKMNINEFAVREPNSDNLQDLCAMTMDSRFTSLFQQSGEFGESSNIIKVIQRIVDYIDLNETLLPITDYCSLREGEGSGDEGQPYADFDSDIEPRNAKLTHVAALYKVAGVSDAFMRAFKDGLTVYPIGKPNANNANASVWYSKLCQNVQLPNGRPTGEDTANACQANQRVALQVMYFALTMDGVRTFFKDPMSVLMAYVGTTNSKLIPSAKKGQPVAFLSTSQIHSYLQDFKRNPQLMAQFMAYSPTYRRMAIANPQMQITPQNPQFPQWQISFDRAGLLSSMSVENPTIFRIQAKGNYGNSTARIETVIDFSKTVRRLPNEQSIQNIQQDSQQSQELRQALREREDTMPRGRVLYWRENVIDDPEDEAEPVTQRAIPGSGGPDAGVADDETASDGLNEDREGASDRPNRPGTDQPFGGPGQRNPGELFDQESK